MFCLKFEHVSSRCDFVLFCARVLWLNAQEHCGDLNHGRDKAIVRALFSWCLRCLLSTCSRRCWAACCARPRRNKLPSAPSPWSEREKGTLEPHPREKGGELLCDPSPRGGRRRRKKLGRSSGEHIVPPATLELAADQVSSSSALLGTFGTPPTLRPWVERFCAGKSSWTFWRTCEVDVELG